jgi:hypothetical protein
MKTKKENIAFLLHPLHKWGASATGTISTKESYAPGITKRSSDRLTAPYLTKGWQVRYIWQQKKKRN